MLHEIQEPRNLLLGLDSISDEPGTKRKRMNILLIACSQETLKLLRKAGHEDLKTEESVEDPDEALAMIAQRVKQGKSKTCGCSHVV